MVALGQRQGAMKVNTGSIYYIGCACSTLTVRVLMTGTAVLLDDKSPLVRKRHETYYDTDLLVLSRSSLDCSSSRMYFCR